MAARASGVLLFGALMSVLVLAQDKPDFSGTWVLESVASVATTPRVLTVRQVLARTNVRGEPMPPFYREIEIRRTSDAGSTSETHHIGIVGGIVGGSVSGSPSGPEGPSTRFRVNWDGQALVLEQGRSSGSTPQSGDWADRREVWTLDSEGRLRLTISTRGSATPAETVTAVYHRAN